MTQKQLRRIWVVICIFMLITMVLFAALPGLQYISNSY